MRDEVHDFRETCLKMRADILSALVASGTLDAQQQRIASSVLAHKNVMLGRANFPPDGQTASGGASDDEME